MGRIIRLNENQFMGVIKNAVNTILENDGTDVLYTAQVVDDPQALMSKYPTEHPNK